MIFRDQDIINYRNGWLETHPDEILDDATIRKCLSDEHRTLVDALIDDDFKGDTAQLLEYILRDGHIGYNECMLHELWEEMNERGLSL